MRQYQLRLLIPGLEIMRHQLLACAACIAALLTANTASATLWNWSFNAGAEAGFFETNGTFADTAGPFNFVIDAGTVQLTASSLVPTAIGDTFGEGAQPGNGFLWDGTTATQFYRDGGALTNGANLYSTDEPYRVTFHVSGTMVGGAFQDPLGPNTGFSQLTLTPVAQNASVPEPASLGVLAAALAGLAFARRRPGAATARSAGAA
jgi:hypothetical protein